MVSRPQRQHVTGRRDNLGTDDGVSIGDAGLVFVDGDFLTELVTLGLVLFQPRRSMETAAR